MQASANRQGRFGTTRAKRAISAVPYATAASSLAFGMSRWVQTENLVLLSGVVLSFLTAWLLEENPWRTRLSIPARVAVIVLAGWAIGLCSKSREYFAPNFVILVAITVGMLLLRKRWLEAAVLTVTVEACVMPWLPAFLEATQVTLSKGWQSQYFHPIEAWIPHVSFYTVGPALTFMLAALGMVLVGLRTLPGLRQKLLGAPAKIVALVLVAGTWAVLVYQLVFAFQGGKTYAHHGFRMEYFNYPLRLRELKDPSDSYICVDKCLYDLVDER